MSKRFSSEREGQIKFFDDLKISADVELIHNTDGVYKGTLFEFKLTIPDINKVLFQAVKYLSHLRLKGEPVPAQTLLVALNEEKAYLFNSGDFLADIEKIYAGAASKNNLGFASKTEPEKIDCSSLAGLHRLTEILTGSNFTKIHIDVFDVVGWAEHFYSKRPKASKSQLFDELRSPELFKDYIYPWRGHDTDFKYIHDLLNAKTLKKELGAFYTPAPYCRMATSLVRRAIKQLPAGHDYIILDRTAGTGNLEEFLTDRPVDDITVGELDRFIDKDLKTRYLRDKSTVMQTFYPGRLNDITVGELEAYKTDINLHDHLSDNEIGHAIVNTYELKEWIVLNERLGDKVKLVIPPPPDPNKPLIDGGDALSEQFVLGKDGQNDYTAIIHQLNDYITDKNTNVILLENPPYRDSSAANTDKSTNKSSKGGYVFEAMKQDLENLPNSNISTARDISNQFIWSAWQYYLKKPDDYFVLFSPIKYWKSLGLGEKKFIDGWLFNRHYFHAGPSAISCILWQNQPDSQEELNLKAYDIDDKGTLEVEDDEAVFVKDVTVKKVYKTLSHFYDKQTFSGDEKGVRLTSNGQEYDTNGTYNDNMVGFLSTNSFSVDPIRCILIRGEHRDGRGMFLRADSYVNYLPLFCAKTYPQKIWYERDIYFTTADGGDRYKSDQDFLKTCFIFTCLSPRNHCRSFDGSDGRFYKNELCFDNDTLAHDHLKSYKLTAEEQDLLANFNSVLQRAKETENYNPKYSYGTYQINQELNTRYKDDNNEWIYHHPELNTAINSLKNKLAKYYETVIQPKLFDYELLK